MHSLGPRHNIPVAAVLVPRPAHTAAAVSTATDGPGSDGSALRGPAGTSYRFDTAADAAHTATVSAVGAVVVEVVVVGGDGVSRTARIAGHTPACSGSPAA